MGVADFTESTDLEEVQSQLDFLARKIRAFVPADCCPHSDAPCLSCALEWMVQESIPISLVRDGEEAGG